MLMTLKKLALVAEEESMTLGQDEPDEIPDPDSGLLMDGESIAHVAKIDVN